MRIGIGNTIPERSNLPGQSGGSVVPLVLSYSSNAFCANASDPTPTVTGNVGAGTFSAGSGLQFLDTGSNTGSSTGVIDISASTPSATPYVITYTDTDSATATFNLTLNALDDAGFSYSASSFAQNFPDPTPTITGLADGTFSGTTGLVIDSSTGVIDLDASTIASHTITYDTTSSPSKVCPNTSTQTINIVAALAQVSNVYSMDFDGTSDFIGLGDSDDFSFGNEVTDSPFSLSGWVKPDDLTIFRFINKWSGSLGYEYLFSTNSSDQLSFIINSLGTVSRLGITTSTLTSKDWQHWVATYDGTGSTTGNNSGMKIYINGVEVTTSDANSGTYVAMQNTTAPLKIGTEDNNFYYANGKIDEVAVFNTALTAREVKSIYLATEVVAGVNKTADLNDLTTPPVKWYRMGD